MIRPRSGAIIFTVLPFVILFGLFFLLFFLAVPNTFAEQTLTSKVLKKKYRQCFSSKKLNDYVQKELMYDTLKKVENVDAGPYKVKGLVKDDPLSDAACNALPSFLQTICWGRTLGKYADEFRQKRLNKTLTRQYIGYLKKQTENCTGGLTIQDPDPIFDKMPLLGKKGDRKIIEVFKTGAQAYCKKLKQTEKELRALKEDCLPVPSLIGMTYEKAKDYLLLGLPAGKEFSMDLLVIEDGKQKRYPLDSTAYRKVKQLKIVRQVPQAGILVDRFINLSVVLEPLVPEKVIIKGPASPVITTGTHLQLDAEAVFNNGERNTVTDAPECAWISSDSKVIRIDKGKVELLSQPAKDTKYHVIAAYSMNGKTVRSDPYPVDIVQGKIPVQLIFKVAGPRVFFTNQSGPKFQLWLRYSDDSMKKLSSLMEDFDKIVVFEVVPSTISIWTFDDELMASYPPTPTRDKFRVRAVYKKNKILLKSNWLDFRLESGVLIVPDVSGKTVNEAIKMLKQVGFYSWSIKLYQFAAGDPCMGNEPPDRVVSTDPSAGWSATPDTTIDLTIEGVNVPDILGKTEVDARREIESAELQFSSIQGLRFDPQYQPGHVSRQNPGSVQCVRPQTMIVATLNGTPVSATVPNLVGKTQEDAEKIVAGTIFSLKVMMAKRHASQINQGVILQQTPAAGTAVQPNSATVITVSLNPPLPQIGIRVQPDRRSYPLGLPLKFTEDVTRKNPSNTYTFQWFIDGKFYAKGDFCHHIFTTPGWHYVQLVMTSTDPQENDAIIRNIGIEYPPSPEISIKVQPELPIYQPGARVTFICVTRNLPDATAYNWYIDNKFIGKKKRHAYTLGGEGRYTVRVGVRRGSNFDEIKVERVVKVGPSAIKPLGRWVNKFQPAGPATHLRVCSSYWIPGFSYSNGLLPVVSQKSGWSKCSTFDTIGAVDGYSLYTGEQADGHNSGWMVFSPAGSGKIKFKVYGFKFGDPAKTNHAQEGFTRYAGSIDPKGILLPSSLSFTQKHARSGTVQWQTEEGLTCSARIHKFKKSTQGTITAHVFVPGGVDNEQCVEGALEPAAAIPPNGPGVAGAAASSLSNAIQAGNTFQNKLAGNAANQSGSASQQGGNGNLQNVTVSQKNVTLTFWDHGKEDGDIITLYLNGKVLKENIKLTKKKKSFPVTLTSGNNLFEVEAKNEGSIPPNTASVRISHVTKGRGTQIYERKSGQRASMNLYAP